MEVGDLVTLSAKAKQLAWLEQVLGTDKQTLLHGVIVNKKALTFQTHYQVHWFYEDGTSYCPHTILRLERHHLKRFISESR
jgi:uncharacterized protein YcfL